MRKTSNLKKYAAVVVLLVVGLWAYRSAYGQPWDGNGVEGDPYQIWTAEDMQAIGADSNYWDAHFRLMADVNMGDVTASNYNSIGYYYGYYNRKPFTGVLDGDGHRIMNFTYHSDTAGKTGIIAYMDGAGQVRNISVENPNIVVNSDCVGALVAYMRGGSVIDCSVEGGSISGDEEVGGLVGFAFGGNITRCYAESVEVNGTWCVGGLVGKGYSYAKIFECCTSCAVQGSSCVGGFVGRAEGVVRDCYATGVVEGSYYVGGFIGAGGEGYAVENCYSTCNVNCMGDNEEGYAEDEGGYSNCGGFAGQPISWGPAETCLWDVNTSGWTTSGSGVGKTTEQMQSSHTFISAGWDFNTPIWKMCYKVAYPILWWEECPEFKAPILHSEPEMTIGNSNLISWGPVDGADKYAAECADDPNFSSIINDGLTVNTEFEFVDLESKNRYWYRVKAQTNPRLSAWWQKDRADFEKDVLDNTTTTSFPGDVVLANKYGLLTLDTVGGTDNRRTTYPHVLKQVLLGRFRCDANRLLTQIEIYFDIHTAQTLDFLVYEAMSKRDSYNLIHHNSVLSGTGEGWHSSGSISIPLVSGRYYYIGVGYTDSVHYYYNYKNAQISWGRQIGGRGHPYPILDSEPYTDSSFTAHQRFTTMRKVGYLSSGSILSTEIYLPEGGQWADLELNSSVPAGTNLTVDILDANNNVIVPDVKSGTNLGEITVDCIKLLGNLSTADPNATSFLHDWLISYYDPATIFESDWSNVESSVQVTLGEAVETVLDTNSLKSEKMMTALLNKIDVAQAMIEDGRYRAALNKLENDILAKTDGCAESGDPDKSDWIITCEAQDDVYPLIIETIDHVMSLME